MLDTAGRPALIRPVSGSMPRRPSVVWSKTLTSEDLARQIARLPLRDEQLKDRK